MSNKFAAKIARKISAVFPESQLLRFVIVGVINTILAYAVYALALALGFIYATANLIALVTGILTGFAMQGKLVFNCPVYHHFWRFLLCWMSIYCANVAIIRQLIELHIDPYTAGALALPVIVPLSFMAQKYFVFTHGSSTRNPHSYTESDDVNDVSERQ